MMNRKQTRRKEKERKKIELVFYDRLFESTGVEPRREEGHDANGCNLRPQRLTSKRRRVQRSVGGKMIV